MPKIDSISYLKLQTGLINVGAVSKSQMPIDALTESINMKFDRIGAAESRAGTTLLGASGVLSGNILGLYEFRDSGSGSNNRIIAVNGTVAYYLSGSTWTSKRTGLTTGNKARFTTFLDFVWMVNGVDATAIWDGASGNSFLTNGNATSAPIGKFIDVFRSRIWIAGDPNYPDRLYFSSLPSAVTTPVITWNTSVTTGDWMDISPSDGENITCIKRNKTSLVVFKNNHIYRVSSISATEPDPTINVGTYSAESVVTAASGLFFHHPTGFYQYADGGQPVLISKPIIDIVKNITVANYSNINGWLELDGDNVVWSVGDVTIDGVLYSSLEVRYTISTETWTHYQKPTQTLCSSRYNDGTTLFQLIGDTAGSVLKMDTGTTDNGTPISISIIHRWYNLDGLTSTRKNLIKGLFSHENGSGFNVAYQNEKDIQNPNDWSKKVGKGQLETYDTIFNNMDVRGRECRFRVSGFSVGEPFVYNGFEILDGTSDLISF